MTDKEINNKCDGAICPHYRQCVLLQRKEQELKNEKEAARIDLEILNQACLDLRNELEEKEQECEELKREIATAKVNYANQKDYSDMYYQALEKIEEILKDYANSKMGELQPDGTYRYLLNSTITGKQYLTYDPRKAQEGLEIINEVKGE